MHEYIQPKNVMEALYWLKQNNPLYKDVDLCPDWENKWEDGDPDLWEAIAKALQQDMEVDEVASPAPVSPLPTGNNYLILAHLAKRRSLKIKDVPGDGNCFFHAVEVALTSVGVQTFTGPDIWQKLIKYMETTPFKDNYVGFLQIHKSPHRSPQCETLTQQQRQEYDMYIDGLRNGAWADTPVVQGVADMLNLNITVIKTITPECPHNVHPQHGRSHVPGRKERIKLF